MAKISKLWLKFAPKGRKPLNDFYNIMRGEGVPGPHSRAKFHHRGLKNV